MPETVEDSNIVEIQIERRVVDVMHAGCFNPKLTCFVVDINDSPEHTHPCPIE
jgi:hypothetical protein